MQVGQAIFQQPDHDSSDQASQMGNSLKVSHDQTNIIKGEYASDGPTRKKKKNGLRGQLPKGELCL